jgi:hypothetical protein
MSGTVPWVAVVTLELLLTQPGTVWRQVPAARSRSMRTEKSPPASRVTEPLGGTIDDPLPADYERSGRKLPGPVLRAARPAEDDAPPGEAEMQDVVHRLDPATARLRDVIGPVERAAATNPVEPIEPTQLDDSPADERGDLNEADEENAVNEREESESTGGPSFPDSEEEAAPTVKTRSSEKVNVTKDPEIGSQEKSTKLAKNEPVVNESKKTVNREKSVVPSDTPKQSDHSSQPVGLLLGLFASLAANVFLLWTAASQRTRYRALVDRRFGRRVVDDDVEMKSPV